MKKADIGLREIAEDVVQFFRHLNHIDAALRRELLAPYFDAVKVPRTNLDDLCALLEKRLVTRMKPRTDQTPPPLTASGSSAPAKTVSGTAAEAPSAASALSGSTGRILLRYLSLQSGSTLEQKLSRAGITTDQVRYIV